MQCVCISERRIKIELIRYLMYTFEKNEENKKEKEIDVTLVTYIYIYISWNIIVEKVERNIWL